MTPTTKKLLIAAIVFVAAACAAGFFYWQITKDERSRKANPENYVVEALVNTLKPGQNKYDTQWIFDILSGRHTSDISFKLKDVDMPTELQQYLNYARLASLNLNITRDGEEMSGTVGVSAAGTPVAAADVYMSGSELALRLPQGFDYFITLDPKAAPSEWDSSNLGSIIKLTPLIGDSRFYSGYMQFFTKFSKPENLLRKRASLLTDGASYEYLEKVEKTYKYSMTLRKDNFNQWYNLMIDDLISSGNTKNLNIDFNTMRYFSVDDDIRLLLHVTDGVVRVIEASTTLPGLVTLKADIELNGAESPLEDISAGLVMDNPNPYVANGAAKVNSILEQYLMLDKMPAQVRVSFEHSHSLSADATLFSRGGIAAETSDSTVSLDWDFSWDRTQSSLDNFKVEADAEIAANGETFGLSFNMAGNVLEADDKKSVMASFSDISLRTVDFIGDEYAAGIELKYNLSAASGADIGYDRDTALHVSEVSPLKLLKIYSNFKEDPVLGSLLTEYLP